MNEIEQRQKEDFHAKVNDRFIVRFEKPFDIPSYVCKGITRPSFSIDENNVKSYDVMLLKFYDPIEKPTTEKIMRTLDKTNNIDFDLEMLDPVGDVVEKWVITGKVIHVDFGELDWQNAEPVEIEMVVKIKTCILEF